MPFRPIDDPTKLRRVLEATLLIEAGLELPAVLRHVVEEACSMTGARYGALGVLAEDRRTLSEFIAVGLSVEEEDAIGARPTGRGVLGLLIADPRPLRMASIGDHPDSIGFPPGHPPMASFLGSPIRVREEVYGNLYLTDKSGSPGFSPDDVALVEALSIAAGIAIENARLHARVRRSAVFEDRDRMARDLHDTVIQQLFALGLSLQSLSARVPDGSAGQLRSAVEQIDRVIAQVRSTIYELGAGDESRGLRDDVDTLVHQLGAVVGCDVDVTVGGPVDTAVPIHLGEHLLAAIREVLAYVGTHAEATRASVDVTVAERSCRLTVGFDAAVPASDEDGPSFASLRHRAEKLHGAATLELRPGGGTTVAWQVPLGT